jgi:hypothetical protein
LIRMLTQTKFKRISKRRTESNYQRKSSDKHTVAAAGGHKTVYGER